MSRKTLDPEQLANLSRLAALPEEAIDTVDIPEIAPDKLALAQRGNLYRPRKQPVTIRLDADVVQWFKDRAAGGKYQSEINRVLRQHVVESAKKQA